LRLPAGVEVDGGDGGQVDDHEDAFAAMGGADAEVGTAPGVDTPPIRPSETAWLIW